MMKMHYKQWLMVCTMAVVSLFTTNLIYAQEGNTCDTPLEITALPFDHAGNMADYGNDYTGADVPELAPGAVTSGTGSASYLSGDDVVYAYTPAENGVVNISITNGDDWIGLWAFAGCPFESTVGYDTQMSGTTRAIEGLSVLGGTTYYFVVSNWPTVSDLDYTIHVEADVPDCPDLGLNIGTPCDDGDPNTYFDAIDENCECTGIPGATNDEACTATALECGDDIAQSLIGATASMTDACFGNGTSDVWFSFVSDGSELYTVSENTPFDAIVQLFVGDDCENLTEAGACADFNESYTITEAGTYYFRVRPYSAVNDEGIIGVALECIPYDCPELFANIGDACDDGDPNTIGDVFTSDCECEGQTGGECLNSTRFPSATIEASLDLNTIASCGWRQEYSEIGSVMAGEDYEFTATNNTYITVRSGAVDGAVVATGYSPLTITAPDANNLFVHWNVDHECGTATGCITSTVQCLTCPIIYDCPDLEANIGDACDDGDPNTLNDAVDENCDCVGILPQGCENSSRWPTATVSVEIDLVTITACNYLEEYSEISGIQAGEDYVFTVTGDGFITVRSGAVGGDVVGMGFSPLTVTAPGSDNLFVHWSAGADCSTASSCVTTTVACPDCPVVYDCPELEVNFGDACDDGNAGTANDTVDENCDCVGTPVATNDEACTATALECGDDIQQSLVGASASLEDACFGTGSADVWFTFVSDGSQIYTVSENTSFDAVVQLFVGDDCENLTEAGACADFPESYTITEAGTYYFRVRPYYASGDEGNIGVALECIPYDCPELLANVGDACDDGDPNTANDVLNEDCECAGIPVAANDEACTATALECGDDITQSLIGATSSLTDACSGSGSADVWFTFVSDGSEVYTISEYTSFDAIVQLFEGDDCGELAEVGSCSDFPESYTITEAGTYYFRVRPWSSSSNEGNIGVSLECVPYDCPELLANFGDACDDGDPNTTDDVINENCECMGSLPGQCLNSSRYPSNVFNASADHQTIATCAWRQEYTEIGSVEAGEEYEFTATPLATWITVRTGAVGGTVVASGYSPLTMTAPNADNLFVHWNTDDDCGTASGCIVTTVQCLTCAVVFDCPELEANFGDSCDDGDPNTTDDVITEDCECVGIPVPDNNDCDGAIALECGEPVSGTTVNATASGLSATCDGYTSSSALDVFYTFEADGVNSYTATATPSAFEDLVLFVYSGACGELVEVGCSDSGNPESVTLDTPEAGTYYVRVFRYSGTANFTVDLSCTPPPFDCPELEANIGDACDDGDANTENDTVNADCECVGEVAFDCPELEANIGDACDDGDANTENDTVNADCECVGEVVFDCPELEANIGDACDDGDANTENDTVNADCECVGEVVFDCPELEANIGDACDDGDASTENDTVNADCECVGTPICADPQPAVEGLWQEYVEGEGILFHWDAVPNSIGCQFRLYTADMTLIQKTNVYGFEMDQLLAPQYVFDYATDYIFGIRCGCSDDPMTVGPWSSLEFTTPGAANMVSSPNPTSGISNVAFEVAVEEHVTLEVYDMSGRSLKVLYHGQAVPTDAYRFQFDGSGLPAGVYIYRLTTDSEVVIEKFMIAK